MSRVLCFMTNKLIDWLIDIRYWRLRTAMPCRKNQSNLAKGGIAVASPLNSSFVFARWQHRTDGLAAVCNCMFRFDPQISPSPRGQRPHLAQRLIGPHERTCRMASKRCKQGARMWQTDDRQTTPRKNCVAIGGVACAARAIAPNSVAQWCSG